MELCPQPNEKCMVRLLCFVPALLAPAGSTSVGWLACVSFWGPPSLAYVSLFLRWQEPLPALASLAQARYSLAPRCFAAATASSSCLQLVTPACAFGSQLSARRVEVGVAPPPGSGYVNSSRSNRSPAHGPVAVSERKTAAAAGGAGAGGEHSSRRQLPCRLLHSTEPLRFLLCRSQATAPTAPVPAVARRTRPGKDLRLPLKWYRMTDAVLLVCALCALCLPTPLYCDLCLWLPILVWFCLDDPANARRSSLSFAPSLLIVCVRPRVAVAGCSAARFHLT